MVFSIGYLRVRPLMTSHTPPWLLIFPVAWKMRTVNIAKPSIGPGHLPAHNAITERRKAAIVQISARIISAEGEMKYCAILAMIRFETR